MTKIAFKRDELADFREALSAEWLETNGLGGYASGTMINCHSRKYHGLLVVRREKPAGVFVLVSALEDALVAADGFTWPLVSHEYGGNVIHPDGHFRQQSFEQEEMPTFTYGCGAHLVTRRIMMLPGRDVTLVRYDLGGEELLFTPQLVFRPLLAFRDLHKVTKANGDLVPTLTATPEGFTVQPYPALPRLHVQVSPAPEVAAEPAWFYNFHYSADARRGLEHTEDLFAPALVRVPLARNRPVFIALGTEPVKESLADLWMAEEHRRQRLTERDLAQLPPSADLGAPEILLRLNLQRSARQFMLKLKTGYAVHAGYHWFGPWGRDTLIALPGIAFQNGELEFGADVLAAFAKLENNGLLPNFVNADGSGAYTAVDPSLWFFWSVQQYIAAGGSLERVREQFWPTMLSIVRNFMAGHGNGIQVDVEDGLVRTGTPGNAVSWMDAQVGGRPIVPRWGHMVEINALWYNAVCLVQELAQHHFRETVEFLDRDSAIQLRHSFIKVFWKPDGSGLYDCVNEFSQDDSLRANALIAVSLPHSPLSPDQQKVVLQAIKRELFTPLGLRSLTPADLRYRGVCQGENWVRELAYHQGSVWPWFLAHFAEAIFRCEGRTVETMNLFQPVVQAFAKHLRIGGIGSISEVFDGDAPHTQRGAISQAWNVGEVLRLLRLLASPADSASSATPEAAPESCPEPKPKKARAPAKPKAPPQPKTPAKPRPRSRAE